ncbi:MAG TPA: glycosyltransferase [Dongiaceae bacterium]|nr:glycosyltransferase [Dongiaceae bacterium]
MKRDANTPTRQRIVFVINSLEGGGAERVLSILLDQLALSLSDVDLYLVLLDQAVERYTIPPQVNKITLDCRSGMIPSIQQLYRCLRQIQPDQVLSFLNRANCANIVAARLLGYRCLISERINTSSHFGSGWKAAINKAIVRVLYPLADRVLVVSRGVGVELEQRFNVSTHRLQVIYNPYDLPRLAQLATQPPAIAITGDYIVSVGRLVPNKNFNLLIKAYQQAGLQEKLVILGEGPEHAALQQLINDLQLQERVILGGFLDNPYAVMGRARLAVFSSLAEGFPNAMAEAMALGLPVIATDCESGPAEILHDCVRVNPNSAFKAEHGVLVPVNDQTALVQALQWMSDPALHAHYCARSRERIRHFSIEQAVAQYGAALALSPTAEPVPQS